MNKFLKVLAVGFVLAVGGAAVGYVLVIDGVATTRQSPGNPAPSGLELVGSHALDGMRFVGPTGTAGNGPDHEDVVVFADGMFRSARCEEFGFGAATYTATNRDGVIHFTATMTSPTSGNLEWQGQIDGDSVEATFKWTKERWYWTIRREYWFKGSRQQ